MQSEASESNGCEARDAATAGAAAGHQEGADDGGAITPGGYVNGGRSQEFLSTGRTGRRNAMPDILGQNASTSTGDLPNKFDALTTDAADAGARSHQQPEPQQRTG